jgi:hypothetical protein
MESKEIFYVGSKDGWQRWDLTKVDIRVDQKVREMLQIISPVHLKRVADIGGDYGIAGVSIVNQQIAWTVPILRLGLKAKYNFTDGVHTPFFQGDGKLPVLPLKWEPPSGMRLYLQIWLSDDGQFCQDVASHLFACDVERRLWLLPLSNLHDNCTLCYGGKTTGENQLETVKKVCKDFANSPWNADLYKEADLSRTRAMFRFKPTKDSFEQLPVLGKHWTEHCIKVSNDAISQHLAI